MVRVNERFSFEKDSSGWTLYETRKGVNPKTKEPTETKVQTYWSNIVQVCDSIIDRSCDQADEMTSIIDCIAKARQNIVAALHGYKFAKGDFGENMDEQEIKAAAG